MEKRKPKVALITGLWGEKNKSSVVTTLKLINLIISLSSKMTWVVTNYSIMGHIDFNLTEITCKVNSKNILFKILCYLSHQLKISIHVLHLIIFMKYDIFIFAFGADILLIPILIAKIFRKKIILRIEGRNSVTLKELYHDATWYKVHLFMTIESIVYILVDTISLEFGHMIELYGLQGYQDKITIGNLYVDTNLFKCNKEFICRCYHLGYIGRFSEEKGVIEFVASLPLILKYNSLRAVIIGDGSLKGNIKQMLVNSGLQERVDLIDWIKNENLSSYLNNVKIVVVPSYREGVPNVLLEAMACGCIVLATPVGGIPSIIKNGENGFLMEDNSPECIAQNIRNISINVKLDTIIANSKLFVENTFTYKAVQQRWNEQFQILARKQ